MRVNFCSLSAYPKSFNAVSKSNSDSQKEARRDFEISLTGGTIAGVSTALIMSNKKCPRIFLNSVEIGCAFACLTYMMILLSGKKNN